MRQDEGYWESCCHHNFKKSQYTNAFKRAVDYCNKFGFNLPASARTWLKAHEFALEGQQKQAALDIIKNEAFSQKLYPDSDIITVFEDSKSR